MDRAVVDRGGRPVGQELGHHVVPHVAGVVGVSEPRLGREGVLEQPLVEGHVIAGAELGPLWRVNMEVDETRNEHLVRPEFDVHFPVVIRCCNDRGDHVTIDLNHDVFADLEVLRCGRLKDSTANRKHDRSS